MRPRFIDLGAKDTRSGFGVGLLEAAQRDSRIVALSADLMGSVKMEAFAKHFPERFFQAGVSEANMIGVAAGLATTGLIPFVGTFANFATGRVYDQIRQSVCYSKKNVKIAASHAGLTLGEDGATHQMLEDIGMMRGLPEMTVISPCDFNQTRLATLAAAQWEGPVYLRFGRPVVPNFTPADDPSFEIGKVQVLLSGTDGVIFATGHMVWHALQASYALEEKGLSIAVVNVHTLKPVDEMGILSWLEQTPVIVTAEEHQVHNGLGDIISHISTKYRPRFVERVAVQDTFGESGKPDELLQKYGLTAHHIIAAVERAIQRK
ncbi:MAG: transketolase family protein [Bacteroidia bacterium]|nr:transketolase family protein [Bacteroidia bacterium]MCX7651370.1 transketolase family protein [Bacteroidia bacterium]MDW8416730.1 transketolase C-terminal domain-containing protein [Bacteroidia bacterium]